MRVLALEPYYGGSHRHFIDSWIQRSSHEWTILTLPPHKWKWRMRHAAVTFAEMVYEKNGPWDLVFCSDMLNLAEFRGLAPKDMRDLPSVMYFHENQLTYPVRHEDERDFHYVVSNIISCLASDRVWFNSQYHLDAFTGAIPAFLKKMPDFRFTDSVEKIRARASVRYPGIPGIREKQPQKGDIMNILWAARWEHDKNPELLYEALNICASENLDFSLSIIGEQFREEPGVFSSIHRDFKDRIRRWGFQKNRDEYEQALIEADIAVSTANHEFFGISMLEAAAAGAFPLVPDKLSYPELFGPSGRGGGNHFFYNGTAESLAAKLCELYKAYTGGNLWNGDPELGKRTVQRFLWDTRAPEMDEALENVTSNS